MRDKDYKPMYKSPDSLEDFARSCVEQFRKAEDSLPSFKHPFLYSCIAEDFRRDGNIGLALSFHQKAYNAWGQYEDPLEPWKPDIILERFAFFLLHNAQLLTPGNTDSLNGHLAMAESLYAMYLYLLEGNIEKRIVQNLQELYEKMGERTVSHGLGTLLQYFDEGGQVPLDLKDEEPWHAAKARLEGIIAEYFEMEDEHDFEWTMCNKVRWGRSPTPRPLTGTFELHVA